MLESKPGLKSKLQRLPQQQQDALYQWLVVEEITYKAAIARLQTRYGVVAGSATLSGFYHRVCIPRLAKMNPQPERVLLDVVLRRRKDGSLQVVVLKAASGVALYGHKNLSALVRRDCA